MVMVDTDTIAALHRNFERCAEQARLLREQTRIARELRQEMAAARQGKAAPAPTAAIVSVLKETIRRGPTRARLLRVIQEIEAGNVG